MSKNVLYKTIPLLALLLLVCLAVGCILAGSTTGLPFTAQTQSQYIELPKPGLSGTMSVEEALFERRSIREYAKVALSIEEVSQLLWAAQGTTAEWGGRTAPSAGGLYPLEVYLEVGNVESLGSGVYKYKPEGHELLKITDVDIRTRLFEAALSQQWVKDSAADIIITAIYERTTVKYGERGIMYVHMEAGHAAQNICLQATSLDLGAVTVGAFDNDQIKGILGLSPGETPLYIIPVGKKKS